MSYALLFGGISMLLYSAYSFFYPKNIVTVERIAPPSPTLTSWQKELICSRTKPSPLFLNFYGDLKEMKIVIIFGREKELARIVLYPALTIGGKQNNISGYAAVKDGGLKSVYNLNEEEIAAYAKNMTLSPDEEKFLKGCYARADAFKLDI